MHLNTVLLMPKLTSYLLHFIFVTSFLSQTEIRLDKKRKAVFVNVSHIQQMTKYLRHWRKHALHPISTTQLNIILVTLHITSYFSRQQARLSSAYVLSGSILPHTCWVPQCPAGHTDRPHSPCSHSHKMWCGPGNSPRRLPLHITLFLPLHHEEVVIIRHLPLSSRKTCAIRSMPRTGAVNEVSAGSFWLLEQFCTVWSLELRLRH